MTTLRISAASDVSNTAGPSCGFNVSEDSYYTEIIFLDRCRGAKIPSEDVTFDANGYVTAINSGNYYQFGLFSDGTADTAHRGGTYELTWDGDQIVSLSNGGYSNVVTTANKITFDRDGTEGAGCAARINAAGPGSLGPGYPRNFKCLRTHDHLGNPVTDKADHAAGELFHPLFRAAVQNLPLIRFMETLNNNRTNVEEWADHPTVNSHSWIENWPYEIVCELCNRYGITPWITLPGVCSDDYIRQAATVVRDNLDPGLIPIFEMGNEPWNTSFVMTWEYQNRAVAKWPAITQNTSHNHWYAKRSTEMSLIVRSVFGSRPLRTVFNTQQGSANLEANILLGTTWRSYEPGDTYSPGYDQQPVTREGVWSGGGNLLPHTVHDAVGNTCYFGHDLIKDNAAQLLSDFGSGDAAGIAAAKATMLAAAPATITAMLSALAYTKSVCDSYGLDLYIYEGSHHFAPKNATGTVLWDSGAGDLVTVNGTSFHEVMEAAIYSAEMGGLQEDMLDGLKALGVKNIALYNLIRSSSVNGYWGYRTHYGDSNPMWPYVEAWSAANKRWWLR